MLLAASDDNTTKKNIISLLVPPNGSEVGDVVFLEGRSEAPSNFPEVCNPNQWTKIVEKLSIQKLKPSFNGKKLVTNKGEIYVKDDLEDGSEIH
jgi:hypothetical protein